MPLLLYTIHHNLSSNFIHEPLPLTKYQIYYIIGSDSFERRPNQRIVNSRTANPYDDLWWIHRCRFLGLVHCANIQNSRIGCPSGNWDNDVCIVIQIVPQGRHGSFHKNTLQCGWNDHTVRNGIRCSFAACIAWRKRRTL